MQHLVETLFGTSIILRLKLSDFTGMGLEKRPLTHCLKTLMFQVL